MVLILKLQYEADIRRTSFEDRFPSVSNLFTRIKTLFSELAIIPSEKLFISYKDKDGDDIRVTNDLEYEEALSNAHESNGDRLLKLSIRIVGNPSKFASISTTHPTTNSTVSPMNNMISSMLSNLYNNNNINSSTQQILFPQMVNSILRGSPHNNNNNDTNTNTNIGNFDVVSAMSNIAKNLPAEQVTPIILSLMQSPVMQQMVSQLCSSFLAAQQPAAKTAPEVAHTGTSPEPNLPPTTTTTSTATSPILSATSKSSSGPSASVPAIHTKDVAIEVKIETASACTSTTSPSYASVGTSTSSTSAKMVDATTETPSIAPSKSPLIKSVAIDPFSGSKFGAILHQLKELGFDDTEKNIAILAKHSGDLDKAIDDLVLDQ